MVTSVNGGLSNGSLDKRQLENGYHPSGSTSKYKIRKVSAVRDFPPLCGPNAPPLNSNPEENVVLPVGGDNVGKEVEANGEQNSVYQMETLKTLDAVKCPTHEEANESLDDLVENAVAVATDGLINGVEEMKIDVQPLDFPLPNGVGSNAMDVSKEMNEAEAQAIMEECGKVEGVSVIDRVDEEKKPVLESGASVDEVVSVDGSKACVPPESSLSDSINFKEENSTAPKDKFRTRRVSAIRDFPPLCGPNAPRESKYEPQRVTSGNMSLVEVPNVKEEKCETNDTLNHEMETWPLGQTSSVDMGNDTLEASLMANKEVSLLTETVIAGSEELEGSLHDSQFEKSESKELVSELREESETLLSKSNEDNLEVVGKEIVLYSQDNSDKSRPSETVSGTVVEVAREVVHGLMAEPYCPWRRGKSALSSSVGRSIDGKVKRDNVGWRRRSKAVAKKSIPKVNSSERSSTNKKMSFAGKTVDGSPCAMIVKYEGGSGALNAEPLDAFPSPSTLVHGRRDFDVSLPPFGPNSSSLGDARNRVRETLRLFQAICRKLLQGEEAKSGPEGGGITKQSEKSVKRIDLRAAKMIKEKGKEINTGTHHVGAVPGVEVGDEFQYRVELAIVGIHRLYQAGIDYLNRDGMLLATSIVASGAYADDMENADVLVYSGQGGNVLGKNKQPEDQKLERGNLALKNCISERSPVRVIHGSKEMKASDSLDAKDKIVTTYVYDGLYMVERFWTETGTHGKMVFKFELRRIPGQPELAWKEVKLSKKSKKRQGVCIDDISGGKETFPICAVNTIDIEKPPTFTYITKMMYPDWFRPIPPKGCDCNGRCSDSRKCSCAVKNGGEIPYNYNGAIVEAKPLVYECGPSCKCPPSCYNRVTQRGTKIKIEIFKTESRGWGVRSLSFIPSGSFICEYAGELLEDKEAEQRTGNDEYLFDIGRNYTDCSSKLNDVDPSDVTEDGGYTIDAAQYGNIGRFINHSCTPNLYAQNVLYDHEDTRMPHIMLFAAENIPALQELTYHYNYLVDQVRDSNGNIKMKSCYCGSAECTGRMY